MISYLPLVFILLTIVLVVVCRQFFKNRLINYITLLISIYFSITQLGAFISNLNSSLAPIFQTLNFLLFVGLVIYIFITISVELELIIKLLGRLSQGKPGFRFKKGTAGPLKELKEGYENITLFYKSVNERVQATNSDIFGKMGSLNEQIEKLDSGISNQQVLASNLDGALEIQNASIQIGAEGLHAVRTMYSETAESLNTLFGQIESLFGQNQLIREENATMEANSGAAINYTRELNLAADAGEAKIANILEFINKLSLSVKNIKKMITIIKKITTETNLLAMNASIEAAHAGDAGRGFAVVASEIRELAESSSEATQTITGIVDDIFKEMEKGKDFSRLAKEGFNKIKEAINETVSTIDSLSVSINHQVSSTSEMRAVTESIHKLASQIKDSSEEQEKKTQEIYEATENLNSQAFIISTLISKQKKTHLAFDELSKEFYALVDEIISGSDLRDLLNVKESEESVEAVSEEKD